METQMIDNTDYSEIRTYPNPTVRYGIACLFDETATSEKLLANAAAGWRSVMQCQIFNRHRYAAATEML